jgi:hypothetical protein
MKLVLRFATCSAVQDVDLLFEVGSQVANSAKFPEWKPGNEFKPKRDAMMKK